MLVRQGHTYHFRRAVPVRLRSTVGRAELWASLGTSSRVLARVRAGRLYAQAEDLFAVASDILRITPADPEAELRLLEHASAEEQSLAFAALEQRAALQERLGELRLISAEARHAEETIAKAKAARGHVERLTPLVRQAASKVGEAGRAKATATEMIAGLTAAAEAMGAADRKKPSGPLASSLVEPYFAQRLSVAGATSQVVGQDRSTIRRFLEICGDHPVDAYGRADISRFLATLRSFPAVYGRSPRDRDATAEELVARARASGAATLSDKTIKRHVSALSQFLQFGVDAGHLTATAHRDALSEHRFRASTGAREQRDAWTSAELVALFGSPVWTGSHEYFRAEEGLHIVRDSKFWIPLLALYHGARLEEFADLYRRDLVFDGGTWALAIVPSVNDEGKERRLKNLNSKRTIPLHPEILRMGFLAYVRKKAPRPDDPLFPDLEPQGADGKRGPRVTRWFVEYRKAVGVYRAGVGMHAFRHLALTRLRDVAGDYQQERHINLLAGHALGSGQGGERYDKGPGLAAVAATLALLQYPELDLSHLYVGDAE